jgi:formylglycine-generating enzyme required for sulfatase activity
MRLFGLLMADSFPARDSHDLPKGVAGAHGQFQCQHPPYLPWGPLRARCGPVLGQVRAGPGGNAEELPHLAVYRSLLAHAVNASVSVEVAGNVPRAYLSRRQDGVFPTSEEFFTAAPALANDKQRASFEARWEGMKKAFRPRVLGVDADPGPPVLRAVNLRIIAVPGRQRGGLLIGEANMMPKRLSLGAFLALPLLAVLTLADSGSQKDVGEVQENSIILDLGGGVKLEMVRIPAGSFLMGSPETEPGSFFDDEGPQHKVKFTRAFYLGKYEVTQEQYQKVMGTNPSCFCREGEAKMVVQGMDTRRWPVENLSWADAVRFCKTLSRKDRHGRQFRLPTEAEWEYACRAGTTTPFHFGKELNGKQANCNGGRPYGTKEKGPSLGHPTRVGSYRANAWGLYDMHGNVWEWCQDRYCRYGEEALVDPPAEEGDGGPVVRGGSWGEPARYSRAAHRAWSTQDSRGSGFAGFRIAHRPE